MPGAGITGRSLRSPVWWLTVAVGEDLRWGCQQEHLCMALHVAWFSKHGSLRAVGLVYMVARGPTSISVDKIEGRVARSCCRRASGMGDIVMASLEKMEESPEDI